MISFLICFFVTYEFQKWMQHRSAQCCCCCCHLWFSKPECVLLRRKMSLSLEYIHFAHALVDISGHFIMWSQPATFWSWFQSTEDGLCDDGWREALVTRLVDLAVIAEVSQPHHNFLWSVDVFWIGKWWHGTSVNSVNIPTGWWLSNPKKPLELSHIANGWTCEQGVIKVTDFGSEKTISSSFRLTQYSFPIA